MTNSLRQKETDLQSHLIRIAQPYQCRHSSLSLGIWDQTSRLIEITSQQRSASKFFHFMGVTKQSKTYLQPEEALFMMQCSVLHVYLPTRDTPSKIPLSFDEAYSLWFNQSDISLMHLHVYQYLTRIGFILRRHRLMATPMETNETKSCSIKNANKRKRDATLTEDVPRQMIQVEDDTVRQSDEITDSERSWFSTDAWTCPVGTPLPPRLTFPKHFEPVHIDWLPPDFNRKVAQVQIPICENLHPHPRPSYALLRPSDLQAHSTVYHRLSSFLPSSFPTDPSTSSVFYDMYKPSKHFRKSQPDAPDYFLQIKNSQTPFRFDEIYHEMHERTLTAIVHHGDVSFFSFENFDPLQRLRLNP